MKRTLLATLLWLLAACSAPEIAVRYGVDECAHCKMTISDQRFGAALRMATGKVLLFDAIECLPPYVQRNAGTAQGAQLFVLDHSTSKFIAAETAHFLQSEAIHSPMGAGLAAFAHADSAKALQAKTAARSLDWQAVLNASKR